MALAGIGLIAGKFDIRQRQVEGRFLGRQRAAEERARRSAGLPPVDLAATAVLGDKIGLQAQKILVQLHLTGVNVG